MRIAAVIVLALLLQACSNLKPWVKPYERQRLADPQMQFEPDPIDGAFMNHMWNSREGSRGAAGGEGGGCGCN